MPCYSPLVGYKSKELTEKGKRRLVFNPKYSLDAVPQQVPCGQCVGCRLERSRQWAVRCVHEASLYANNCFITLTYDNDHLPDDRSLNVKHFQDFMKRLRFRFSGIDPVYDVNSDGEKIVSYPIRFYHCGEYGEKYRRPHYHACLFNFDFPDKKLWKQNLGNNLYISEALQELWPYGYSSIGEVTFESAAYVARYIMKKVNGEAAESYYRTIDPDTGEIIDLKPEYTTMSRNPGIASRWYEKYKDDVFPHDYVVMKGKKLRTPKYYDSKFEVENPDDFEDLKKSRKINALKHVDNNTSVRLAVREKCQLARLGLLKRSLE